MILLSRLFGQIDHKKIAAENSKKDNFVKALQARVFNREPQLAIKSLREGIRDKCNTCKLIKPLNQNRKIHNSSPEYIIYLLTNNMSYC